MTEKKNGNSLHWINVHDKYKTQSVYYFEKIFVCITNAMNACPTVATEVILYFIPLHILMESLRVHRMTTKRTIRPKLKFISGQSLFWDTISKLSRNIIK